MKKSRHPGGSQTRTPPRRESLGANRHQPTGARLGWKFWTVALGLVALVSAGIVLYERTRPSSGSSIGATTGLSTQPVAQSSSPLLPAAANRVDPAGTNLDPNVAARQRDSAAAELNRRANLLLGAGDAKSAIRLLSEALALTPNDEDLHYNLGIAYGQAGEVTNAEHEYREALRLLPDYPEVRNNLGNLLLHAGRITEAEEEFTAALKVMPDYAKAHNNLGIVRQRQKRTDEALLSFRKAVECDTNYWEAHFNLANACLTQSNLTEAVLHLRETLRINPSFQPAQRTLDKLQATPPAPGP